MNQPMHQECSPRVLVTGSTGFLGGHLVRRLGEHGFSVALAQRPGRRLAHHGPVITLGEDVPTIAAQLKKFRVSQIVNCLGHYGKGGCLADMVMANLVASIRLLEAAQAAEVNSWVQCDTALPNDASGYALSKGQFREWLKEHSSIASRTSVRLEYFYGEAEPEGRLVSQMINTAVSRNDVMNLSPGEQVRDLVHVDDACAGITTILKCLARSTGYRELPLGSGRGYRLREVGNTICRLAGSKTSLLRFGALPYRRNEVMHSVADISHLVALGWKPAVPLTLGLARVVAAKQTIRQMEETHKEARRRAG